MRYWVQLATEQFPPSALVRQAAVAERAGFDAVNVSDHYQPWWEPGESGHAWALLGAIGNATERVGLGTGVTAPVFRHNPATVAQFVATIPEIAWELSLGIYLTVKGFRPSPITTMDAAVRTPGIA